MTTTERAKMHSDLLLGHSAGWWDAAMLISLAVAAVVAFVVAGATAGSVIANKREAASAQEELERYKTTVAGQVADATKAGIDAGKEAGGATLKAAEANERAAKLEKEAAGLRLELERVRTPLLERRLTPEQSNILEREISSAHKTSGAPLSVILIAPSPNREINAFAKDFVSVFEKAKANGDIRSYVQVIAGSMRDNGINAVPNGLNISGDDGPSKKAIEAALKEGGVPFGSEPMAVVFFRVTGAVTISIGERSLKK